MIDALAATALLTPACRAAAASADSTPPPAPRRHATPSALRYQPMHERV